MALSLTSASQADVRAQLGTIFFNTSNAIINTSREYGDVKKAEEVNEWQGQVMLHLNLKCKSTGLLKPEASKSIELCHVKGLLENIKELNKHRESSAFVARALQREGLLYFYHYLNSPI